MKRLLCYGDSNTYGHNPANGDRLPDEERWTGILAAALGQEWQVIEEGLCGRTISREDATSYGRNGLSYLEPCLCSHFPLDAVVIMLGTNDLQCVYGAIPQTVAQSMDRFLNRLESVLSSADQHPKVLLISPVLIGDTSVNSFFGELFPPEVAGPYSRRLGPLYRKLAANHHCLFLDGAAVAQASTLDGLHMDGENHQKLAMAVLQVLQESAL